MPCCPRPLFLWLDRILPSPISFQQIMTFLKRRWLLYKMVVNLGFLCTYESTVSFEPKKVVYILIVNGFPEGAKMLDGCQNQAEAYILVTTNTSVENC